MNTNSSPTNHDWLAKATNNLKDAGIGTARLDCLVLLEDCLNTNRTHLLAHPEIVLTPSQLKLLNAQIIRRARHEPLAYIRGKTEFYGREFMVNQHVLEPRPESETMIDLLLQLSLKQQINLSDIGSGSGALGITAALEMGLSKVYLHDIDPETLKVAKLNAKKHNVAAKFLQENLINNYNFNYDVLLCNLPYVPENFHINTAATHEPRIAIFGGLDGLDLYRELFDQATKCRKKPSYILTESMPPQHDNLSQIAYQHAYNLVLSKDFIQVFTV
jgi:release factor glutamine methyltransferase